MRGGAPRTICRASPTAAAARRRLCETTTMPTIRTSRLEHLGGSLEEQRCRRGAGVLVATAALPEIAGGALPGGAERPLERHAATHCGVERFERGVQAVEHRLVPELGLATGDETFDAGPERLDHIVTRELGPRPTGGTE